MKRTTLIFFVILISSFNLFSQTIELPKLTTEQRWETAEGNIVYFIISGISFAKSQGQTAADYGTWTGNIGCPYWKSIDSMSITRFVQEISANKQQFKDFQMEILENNNSSIKGRMKGYGLNWLKMMSWGGVSEKEYEEFFANKWKAIADCVGLVYQQESAGEWTNFTVSKI